MHRVASGRTSHRASAHRSIQESKHGGWFRASCPSGWSRLPSCRLSGAMTSKITLTITACVLGSVLASGPEEVPRLPPAPANPPAPSLAGRGRSRLRGAIAMCKTPPPARAAARWREAAPPGGGSGAAGPQGLHSHGDSRRDRCRTAVEIPLAAGRQQRRRHRRHGRRRLLLAQNDNSQVVKLDQNGKPSVVYSDTHTGGALSMNTKGAALHRRARPARGDRAARAAAQSAGQQVSGRAARLHRRGHQ